MTPDYFMTLARYNGWANRRLYEAAAGLPPAELARPRPAAYFGSLLGILNHNLVGDLVWMGRFEACDPGVTRLDAILHEELPALRAAREAQDARIESYAAELTPTALAGDLTYRTMVKPATVAIPLWQSLAHFFNHQTHHRGQAHALLKEAGCEPPALDLIYFLR